MAVWVTNVQGATLVGDVTFGRRGIKLTGVGARLAMSLIVEGITGVFLGTGVEHVNAGDG